MSKSRSTSDAVPVTPDVEDDVTPLERDEFLQANRAAREKLRAEAEAKAAKSKTTKSQASNPETAKSEAGESEAGESEAGDCEAGDGVAGDSAPDDRTPRKLDQGDVIRDRASRWTGWAETLGGKTWAVIALVAAAVVLAASTAVLAVAYVDADRRADTAVTFVDSEILDTARKYAAELSTYDSADYSDLDRRIREISTPEFTKTYIEASQDARRGSSEAKAVSTAKAENAGLTSIDGDQAVVLVTLDQTLRSPDTAQQFPDGVPYQTRVKVTLVEQDGRWLLGDFEIV
ncbi:hypothetical protein [Gordonia aurantiaca]|uniref:hypothetical protein n=1 Tax=Gordonia sp. B21 TaxID=3151852 RepID=UPI0032651357